MQLVERAVHEASEQPLDPQVPAQKSTHQVSNRRILAQGDEGAEIAIAPRLRRLAGQAPPDLLHQMRGLLVRSLRTGRNICVGTILPWASRTVAERKNVLVARCLKCRQYDELVDAIGLKTIQVTQKIRCLHAGRPDHQLSR